MDKATFGKYIAKLRKKENLTQQNLADLLNVSVSAVSKWERGLCFPDLELFPAIANSFDISFEELMSNLHSPEAAKCSPPDDSPSKKISPVVPKSVVSNHQACSQSGSPEDKSCATDYESDGAASHPISLKQPVDPSHKDGAGTQLSPAYEDADTAVVQQQVTVKRKKWLKPSILCSFAVIFLFACFLIFTYHSMQQLSFSVLKTEVVYEKMYEPTESDVFTIHIQVHGKYTDTDIAEYSHAIHESWEDGSAEFETDADIICLQYYDTSDYEGTECLFRSYLLKSTAPPAA